MRAVQSHKAARYRHISKITFSDIFVCVYIITNFQHTHTIIPCERVSTLMQNHAPHPFAYIMQHFLPPPNSVFYHMAEIKSPGQDPLIARYDDVLAISYGRNSKKEVRLVRCLLVLHFICSRIATFEIEPHTSFCTYIVLEVRACPR